ncbi:MAG: ammonia-forming cytochrome c nitrite reductase subunit c552, partial [Planctomycetes bacterium]|nr:ammonia-forming cytochrome c nitrite reductase subunit c552 [Planctomycetota bacterium]
GPFTAALAAREFPASPTDITIGNDRFRYEPAPGGGAVVRRGPDGEQSLPIAHVMGGKNVWFLLTPWQRGRLQVLPIAYDVQQREWYDTTRSMVRHAGHTNDAPLPWTDPLLTFDTSCHGCHVSQLQSNYDLATDSYRTTWQEPGINCETCHGPCGEHVRRCEAAAGGKPPADLALVRYGDLDPGQRNASCGPCHAKGSAITPAFVPGEAFFDHRDVATLEDPDFHPDGRDLGENYTWTGWLMNACVRGGELDCLHCHTSSGRDRFAAAERRNEACLPPHEERVRDAAAHHRHPAGKPGSFCVDCHMPKTSFARMVRSDHSLRPPAPAATAAFGSPNACNLCHADKDTAWAEALVQQWHPDAQFRDGLLARGRLIADARAQQWERLPAMLGAITDRDRDEVTATSLVRLLVRCTDARKWPALRQALGDPSPLVRSAAAAALGDHLAPEVQQALLTAAGDPVRLVRVRAAAALAALDRKRLPAADRTRLEAATAEFLRTLDDRPDDWASHHDRGNFLEARGEPERALAAYRTAARLRPDVAAPLVNASLLQAALGRLDDAERSLRQALAIEPKNSAAWFDLGLLLAERGDRPGAEDSLRAALRHDPRMAAAAYNLGVLLADTKPDEALAFCRQAHQFDPGEPRYSRTLAFYLDRRGDAAGAVVVLHEAIGRRPASGDPYLLLVQILDRLGEAAAAADACRQGLANPALDETTHAALRERLQRR